MSSQKLHSATWKKINKPAYFFCQQIDLSSSKLHSSDVVYILHLSNYNSCLHLPLWRVHCGVTPEQLGRSDSHMPSSEEADQTAKQLLLSWPDPLHTAIMQHAAGAAGQNRLRSYSTRVYICTFYHTLICVQKPGHKHKLRSDWCTRQHYKCIFLILRAGCNRMTRHVVIQIARRTDSHTFGKTRRAQTIYTFHIFFLLFVVCNHVNWTMREQFSVWANQESM